MEPARENSLDSTPRTEAASKPTDSSPSPAASAANGRSDGAAPPVSPDVPPVDAAQPANPGSLSNPAPLPADPGSARPARRTRWSPRRREILLLGIFVVIALAVGINFKRVTVSGVSMTPTFRSGETVLVWRTAKYFSPYAVGDVIVFRSSDGEDLIKRIVFIQNRQGTARMPRRLPTVYGRLPTRILLFGAGRSGFPGYEDEIVDAGQGIPVRKTIFVMGDNFRNSDDSRDFGPIDPDQILGKVIAPPPGLPSPPLPRPRL